MDRAVVWTDDEDVARIADEVWAALIAWHNVDAAEPQIFTHGNVLMHMDPENGLEAIDAAKLADRISRAANLCKTSSRGVPTPKRPDSQLVSVLLSRGRSDYVGAPNVTRVTSVPILSADGEIMFEPGLHPSGVWYRPEPGLEDVRDYVLDHQNVEGLAEARGLLMDDLLGGFDFAGPSDRANALALVLLPFVREFIGDQPTPLHLAHAPQQGSGKTTLVQTCLLPACGAVALSTEPGSDEELRKVITTGLLSGLPSVVFDNLNSRLDSGVLAAALTAQVWRDRILGGNTEAVIPVRVTWAATGNNVQTSSEIRDRVCPIQLEPQGGVPARYRDPRSFRHPDLLAWGSAHRPEMVGACITLIRHWLDGIVTEVGPQGQMIRESDVYEVDPDNLPRYETKRGMGSYRRWSDVMGGILEAASVEGFLGNLDRMDDFDPDLEDKESFLAAIHDWSNGGQFFNQDLVAACGPGAPLFDELPPAVGQTRHLRYGLREWMNTTRNGTYGGYRLCSRKAGGNKHAWWVEAG